MEGLSNVEDSNALRNRIFEIYDKEGYSEELQNLIGRWVKTRQNELDRSTNILERNGFFSIELAEIYIRVKNLEKTNLALGHLFELAVQLDSAFLRQEVARLENSM